MTPETARAILREAGADPAWVNSLSDEQAIAQVTQGLSSGVRSYHEAAANVGGPGVYQRPAPGAGVVQRPTATGVPTVESTGGGLSEEQRQTIIGTLAGQGHDPVTLEGMSDTALLSMAAQGGGQFDLQGSASGGYYVLGPDGLPMVDENGNYIILPGLGGPSGAGAAPSPTAQIFNDPVLGPVWIDPARPGWVGPSGLSEPQPQLINIPQGTVIARENPETGELEVIYEGGSNMQAIVAGGGIFGFDPSTGEIRELASLPPEQMTEYQAGQLDLAREQLRLQAFKAGYPQVDFNFQGQQYRQVPIHEQIGRGEAPSYQFERRPLGAEAGTPFEPVQMPGRTPPTATTMPAERQVYFDEAENVWVTEPVEPPAPPRGPVSGGIPQEEQLERIAGGLPPATTPPGMTEEKMLRGAEAFARIRPGERPFQALARGLGTAGGMGRYRRRGYERMGRRIAGIGQR